MSYEAQPTALDARTRPAMDLSVGSLRAARAAITIVFLANGAEIGLWAAYIPLLKATHHLSEQRPRIRAPWLRAWGHRHDDDDRLAHGAVEQRPRHGDSRCAVLCGAQPARAGTVGSGLCGIRCPARRGEWRDGHFDERPCVSPGACLARAHHVVVPCLLQPGRIAWGCRGQPVDRARIRRAVWNTPGLAGAGAHGPRHRPDRVADDETRGVPQRTRPSRRQRRPDRGARWRRSGP